MTKFKTLLLDLDGTLIDSRGDLADAVNWALVATGQKAQRQEDIVPHVGNGLKTLLTNVMGGRASDEILQTGIAAFSEFYEGHCVDKTVLYPDVADVLKQLHPYVKMGVVTNKPLHFSKMILDALDVSRYFQVIVGGDSTPEKKPHPAPLLKALKDLNGAPNGSLMVGDGPQDVLSARAAGVKSCIARYGYGFSQELLHLKPDFELDTFKEIKEIVL